VRKWKIISPLAALALWQVLASAGVLGRGTPSPVQVVKGLYTLIATGLPPGYHLQGHLIASLGRVFTGFAIAVVIAIPVGVLMGYSNVFKAVMDPLVEIVRPVPPLAWLPLAVVWFGIGLGSAAFIIFLGAFFPVVLNTISGVKSVDPHLVEAARTLGARDRTILARVMVPGALPSIFTGLRIGMGIAWMTLIAAELVGVKNGYGLGYMIMAARDFARNDLLVAGIVVIGLVGFLVDWLIRLAERRLLRWR
jgi:ABC-type nitrate/sulfonate/bicarbonate transport system permease component